MESLYFWSNNKKIVSTPNENNLLTNIPKEWNNYDTILGQQFFINKMKPSKLIKHGLRSLLNNPSAIENDLMNYFLLIILIVWELYWKYKALWISANNNHRKWFIAILIINSLGIIPIYYLYTQSYFLYKES